MTPWRINSHKILKEIQEKRRKTNKQTAKKKQMNHENYEYIVIISPVVPLAA